MPDVRPKILLTFRIGGENGGPYISHKRILQSSLSNKYYIKPLMLENPRKMRNPIVFFKTVSHIKQENPALVHLAGLGSEGFLTMLACRLAKVKTVVAVHGSSFEAIGYGKFANMIFKIMENYTVKKANVVFGVSDYVSSWKICKKSKNYYGTVYNIPTFNTNKIEKPYIRESLGISENDIVIVSTGRITKDKGFDILCEVIKQFVNVPNIKFIIVGEGEYKNEFISQINEFELQGTVFILGYRDDVDSILKESNIFIICTKHETLCISLLEAASNSLPIIASNVGGIPEIIEDKKNGFLVNSGDINGFKNAILKLTKSKELRIKMGIKAKLTVDTTFKESDIINKLDSIYMSVIGGKND